METSLDFQDINVLAFIELNNENGDKELNVDVNINGMHYAIPLSVNKEDIHTFFNINSLFIRAFSPNVFVVFVDLSNGAWPFVCFTRKNSKDFHFTVFYSKDAVADVAVMDDRYIVIAEVVACHRKLFVQCYDMMDTSQYMWIAGSCEYHGEYYMLYTYLDTDEDTDMVSVHLVYGGSHSILVLKVCEQGVMEAEGDTVEWHWKLGSDSEFRTDVVCSVKAALPSCLMNK